MPSAYDATVPQYLRLLSALAGSLDKAATFAAEKKFDPSILVSSRLYPDMYSLAEQVRAACSHMVRGTSRLAGVPIPTFEGSDATLADLKARIVWVEDHLRGLDKAAFAGADEKEIVFPAGDKERRLTGAVYLVAFSLPNVYFHLTAAYAILRHNGVPLGKDDFMGS